MVYFFFEMDDGEYEEEVVDVGGFKKEFCNIIIEVIFVCISL